jgi:hypothetical protein
LDVRARAELNPVFKALSAGLRDNGADIQIYTSSKAKGKERPRTVTTYSEDGSACGTIFVSRPLKQKGRNREIDEVWLSTEEKISSMTQSLQFRVRYLHSCPTLASLIEGPN